ncbi:unnamed protein product [Mytilus coruscus]|uniref:Uncharacterized protein n=1 Tax=Mytilus coruscus TaxID=42192 RepID=A0A6J8BGD7_MYTCO|nr:unnamed protein product [Mytilus coruscus]
MKTVSPTCNTLATAFRQTTHWLQPLDRSIFGPMTTSYNKQCQKFMGDHPSRQVTRYDFCGLFNTAFQSSLNMVNIFSGFRSTGIYPFNQRVIPAEAYGPSLTSVLDTKSPQTEDIPENENTDRSTPMVETPQSTQMKLQKHRQTPSLSSLMFMQYPIVQHIR